MKKALTLLAAAGMFAFLACGPSAKEKEAEQRKLDSLRQDSIMQVEKLKAQEDSIKQAEIEKVKMDSIRKADSIAKLAKTPKKKK